MSRFDQVLSVVLGFEGGYGNDKDDRGGETNYGITASTLSRAHKAGLVAHSDPKALTRAEAAKVYEAFYWKPLNCHVLPDPMDLILFDISVNCGVGGAGKILQETLNEFMATGKLAVDGVVGPKTWAALCQLVAADRDVKDDGRLKPRPIIRGFCLGLIVNRMELYDDITNENSKPQEVKNRKFLRGWLTNRIVGLEKRAGLDG